MPLVAQQRREAGGGVEPGQAEPVDRAVPAHQRHRAAVADGGVVLDRQGHAARLASGLCSRADPPASARKSWGTSALRGQRWRHDPDQRADTDRCRHDQQPARDAAPPSCTSRSTTDPTINQTSAETGVARPCPRGPHARHALHQVAGGSCASAGLAVYGHDAADPQRRQHPGGGAGREHGPVPALGRHSRQAVRAAARAGAPAPGVGGHRRNRHRHARSRPRTSSDTKNVMIGLIARAHRPAGREGGEGRAAGPLVHRRGGGRLRLRDQVGLTTSADVTLVAAAAPAGQRPGPRERVEPGPAVRGESRSRGRASLGIYEPADRHRSTICGSGRDRDDGDPAQTSYSRAADRSDRVRQPGTRSRRQRVSTRELASVLSSGPATGARSTPSTSNPAPRGAVRHVAPRIQATRCSSCRTRAGYDVRGAGGLGRAAARRRSGGSAHRAAPRAACCTSPRAAGRARCPTWPCRPRRSSACAPRWRRSWPGTPGRTSSGCAPTRTAT